MKGKKKGSNHLNDNKAIEGRFFTITKMRLILKAFSTEKVKRQTAWKNLIIL
jgi:hypothetical protein